MKMTLLSMVQKVLTSIDGDQVNSIADTFESEQVADIIHDSFMDIIDRRNWPHLEQFIQFDNSGTTTLPTHVNTPENVKEVLLLTYNKARDGDLRTRYEDVFYMYPDEFLAHTNPRNDEEDNVTLVTDPSGAQVLVLNDRPPTYWTSFNDRTLVLDSYDSAVDSTLVASKFQCQAVITPSWQMIDTFVPFLPSEAFTLLLEESKSMASINLKQMVNEKSEARARKQDRWLARQAFVLKGGVRYANFGRGRGRNRYKKQPLDKDNKRPQ